MSKKPEPNKKVEPAHEKKSTAEPGAKSVKVVATIKNADDLDQLHKLAEKLGDEGMTIDRVLPLSGAITGSCPVDQIAALNTKVPAVTVEQGLSMSPS